MFLSERLPRNLVILAYTLACLGYIDQARALANQALAEVQQLHHAHALAQVLTQACLVERLAGLPHDVRQHAEQTVVLSREHGFPLFSAWGTILLGWSLTELGEAQDGVALLTQGLSAYRAMGGVLRAPSALMMLAEAHSKLGRPIESLNCLSEATQIIEISDERYEEPGLLRLRGDLLEATGDRTAAQQNYSLALTVAARQSAKTLRSALPPVSRACGWTKASAMKPAISSLRSTIGLLRGSTPRFLERLGQCWSRSPIKPRLQDRLSCGIRPTRATDTSS